jgi:signal transduction histidine kinase
VTLRARLFLLFLAPTFVVLALGGFLLFRASRNVLERQLGESVESLAAVVALQVSSDRLLALEADDTVGEGSRNYRALTKTLEMARSTSGVRRLLIFDTKRRALLDLGGGLPFGAEVPELFRDALELEAVFAGEKNASQVLFRGSDGQFYKTGYAPIFHEGVVIAAVAVDENAAFFGPLADLRTAFVGLLALILGVLAVAAVFLARQVSEPLESLLHSAHTIGRGDLATPVALRMGTVEIIALSRELETMRQALESRDRQLKMMLGGVAHEVKNPLGGIELFAGLLQEELVSKTPSIPESLEHLGRIQRELDYLKRIVEDFLSFAREQRVTKSVFDARSFALAAVAHLQPEADMRGVRVSVAVEACALEGDESLLTSALVNVVKNALQVSKPGQTIQLSAEREEPSRLRFEVIDEGPGISAEHQARIFEPFFTTREKGTGLGLPLARKLVEANGGTLEVQSRPGRTCFRFSLRVPAESPR